jgi:uncharacterized protein (TIGR02453 family)
MAFGGFPLEAFSFYEGLQADNSKQYWTAHRDEFERSVRAPFDALAESVDDVFRPLRLFRPYRDLRFSSDKRPYKEAAAAAGELDSGASVYVSLSAAGLDSGFGCYHLAADQLERFRVAVDRDGSGRELEQLLGRLTTEGCAVVAAEELKAAPRGYPKEHPRIGLLRRKGLAVLRHWPVSRWMHTPKALDRIQGVWRAATPLNEWLDDHVGPSNASPVPTDVR